MRQTYYTYIKVFLHKKRVYLWYLLFPMVFSGLLYLITIGIERAETFHEIPIGVVKEEVAKNYDRFVSTMKEVKSENEQMMFQVKECTIEEAKQLLIQQEIDAYILIGETLSLHVKKNGLSQAMIKKYLDQYEHDMNEFTSEEETFARLEKVISDQNIYPIIKKTVEEDGTREHQMTYFYVMIGMCCFQTITFGTYLAELLLSNQTKLAARLNCSATGIFSRFLSALAAVTTMSVIGILILICFLKYVLNCYFLWQPIFTYLLLFVAIENGILLGYMLAGVFKSKGVWKDTMAMLLTVVLCLFSGILRSDIKFYMESRLGFVALLNPISLVANGLFAIFYEENAVGYLESILILSGYTMILFVLSLVRTGRRVYEHI